MSPHNEHWCSGPNFSKCSEIELGLETVGLTLGEVGQQLFGELATTLFGVEVLLLEVEAEDPNLVDPVAPLLVLHAVPKLLLGRLGQVLERGSSPQVLDDFRPLLGHRPEVLDHTHVITYEFVFVPFGLD